MLTDFDSLLPPLPEVDENSDRRRSARVSPDGLQVDLSMPPNVHPRECTCLNISRHGIELLVEPCGFMKGQRVALNLRKGDQSILGITGTIQRARSTERFQTLAVAFDEAYTEKDTLIRLVGYE